VAGNKETVCSKREQESQMLGNGYSAMVEAVSAIRPRERREFRLKNEELALLLFDLTQKLIYYKMRRSCCPGSIGFG
jgi:SHS2 domain-containing protein